MALANAIPSSTHMRAPDGVPSDRALSRLAQEEWDPDRFSTDWGFVAYFCCFPWPDSTMSSVPNCRIDIASGTGSRCWPLPRLSLDEWRCMVVWRWPIALEKLPSWRIETRLLPLLVATSAEVRSILEKIFLLSKVQWWMDIIVGWHFSPWSFHACVLPNTGQIWAWPDVNWNELDLTKINMKKILVWY